LTQRKTRHSLSMNRLPDFWTEVTMSSTDVGAESASAPPPTTGDFKLEVVTLPVSDVDRAKSFYEGLGWRVDADLNFSDDMRVVQLTPPGSACSIHFGTNLIDAEPGSLQRLEAAVDDIEAMREHLISRGVEVSEVFHLEDGNQTPGPDPEGRSYFTLASFSDPDGNGWVLQEITERLPGR
jgi:catechol 2,3-dioxygenase-like lactoylglutathione lyase family enzyme